MENSELIIENIIIEENENTKKRKCGNDLYYCFSMGKYKNCYDTEKKYCLDLFDNFSIEISRLFKLF